MVEFFFFLTWAHFIFPMSSDVRTTENKASLPFFHVWTSCLPKACTHGYTHTHPLKLTSVHLHLVSSSQIRGLSSTWQVLVDSDCQGQVGSCTCEHRWARWRLKKLNVSTGLAVFTLSWRFSSFDIYNLSVAQTVLYISNTCTNNHIHVRLDKR